MTRLLLTYPAIQVHAKILDELESSGWDPQDPKSFTQQGDLIAARVISSGTVSTLLRDMRDNLAFPPLNRVCARTILLAVFGEGCQRDPSTLSGCRGGRTCGH